jgi:hypothetical protein
MKHPLRRLVEFDAHHRVAVALMVAALTFGISSRWLQLPVSLIASWDAFALCSLVLAPSATETALSSDSHRVPSLSLSRRETAIPIENLAFV